ncbi:PilZ domain-containing protein [Candidatus Omnitrophota bacterium]
MNKNTAAENREYVRLDTVFPVEFRLVDDNKKPITPIFQGFTRDVGKGGMCVEVKSEKGREVFKFIPGQTKMMLMINIPSGQTATKSFATVRWLKTISENILDAHTFGVEYSEIESENQKMIEGHVMWLHRRPRIVALFIIILLVLVVLLTYISLKPSL